jgi:hypothetical protein
LHIVNDLVLYKSPVDIQDVVAAACKNCYLGGGLAILGFGALIASVAPVVPNAVFVTMISGALANCYVLCVIAQRVLRNLAARHVEQLVVMPTLVNMEESQSGDGGAMGLHELSTSATAEENLEVTPELRLEIRTACADHWVTLVQPEADAEIEAQPDEMRRASFGDLCQRLRVLHIDADKATLCPDAALLAAFFATPKVVAEERREARTDSQLTSSLRVPEGTPAPGPMLSDLTVADVEEGHRTVSLFPPAMEIDKIGRRARNGGLAILLTGGLFFVGESARDADGVARWTNLNLKI